MKVSIIISSYNGKKDLTVLLDSIRKFELKNHELEIIVRDDKSSDGTVEYISQKYPHVKLIKGDSNIGFVRSNNIAFQHATGDVICCLNQDTIPDSAFLLEGLAVLENHPDIVGVNTNMIMPWVMTRKDFIETSTDNLPAYEYQLTRYGFTQYVQVKQVIRETNFLTGGGFFLRRSALKKDGDLFDPNIRMYCEDTDLSLRLIKHGGILMYTPKAIIFHNQKPKKAGSVSELATLLKITWVRFYVMAKHNSPLKFFKHYPLFLWGIIRKMDYLGLPLSKKFQAYLAAGCLTTPFLLLFPYWLWLSFVFYRKT